MAAAIFVSSTSPAWGGLLCCVAGSVRHVCGFGADCVDDVSGDVFDDVVAGGDDQFVQDRGELCVDGSDGVSSACGDGGIGPPGRRQGGDLLFGWGQQLPV